MFEFQRDNERVMVRIDTDLPYDCEGTSTAGLLFLFNFSEPYIAEAMRRYLRERYELMVNRLARNAYNAGWNDHRTKQRKKTEFGSDLSKFFGY